MVSGYSIALQMKFLYYFIMNLFSDFAFMWHFILVKKYKGCDNV